MLNRPREKIVNLPKFALLALLCLLPVISFGEPTSGPLKIDHVRAYNHQNPPEQTGFALIRLSQPSLCETDTYRIEPAWSGGKELFATALSAFLADKPVPVEVVDSGCTGWGIRLQSLYILKQ